MRPGSLALKLGAIALALLALGCVGDSVTPGGTVGDPCDPTVKLNQASLTLAPGQTGTMSASVKACSLSNAITWIITDTAIAKATVVNDTTATIRAIATGTTAVVASLTARPNVVAPGTIYVQQ